MANSFIFDNIYLQISKVVIRLNVLLKIFAIIFYVGG